MLRIAHLNARYAGQPVLQDINLYLDSQELLVVLGPPADGGRADAERESVAAVAELVAAGVPRRQAVDLVARFAGESRNALYRASL